MRSHLSFVCLAFAGLGTAACGAPQGPPAGTASEPRPSTSSTVEGVADAAETDSGNVENLATRTAGDDWPAFLGPTADSKSSETGILRKWGESGPPVVWHLPVGNGYGMPSISKGRLFHFDRHGDLARLTCMTSETGEELWRFEYPTNYEDLYNYDNGPRACPVVDGDRVYIYGAEGMLDCLRVTDGRPVWQVDTVERFGVVQNFFGVGAAPVIENDLLIVQVGGSPAESQRVPPGQLDLVKPNGSGVVAFDKFTGEVRYQCGDELASYAVPVLATIGDRRWCLVFARGGLLALEPASGKIDFHFDWRAPILESVNASNPVVVDDVVFISETYGPGSAALRVKPDGYDVLWSDADRGRNKVMQMHWNTAVHHQGFLYGSSGRHTENAELRCIELATGTVRWSQPDLGRSSLLYVDGHFVCLTEHGRLLLIEATPDEFRPVADVVIPDPTSKSGAGLLQYPAWAAPILSHGLLYVRGKNRLVCLELIPKS